MLLKLYKLLFKQYTHNLSEKEDKILLFYEKIMFNRESLTQTLFFY